MRIARVALGVAAALALLFVVTTLARVSPRAIGAAIVRADAALFAFAVLLSLVLNTFQSAALLRSALRATGVVVPFRGALAATTGSLTAHATLPVGSGHALRVAYLCRVHGADPVAGSAAVALILLLKLAVLAGSALLGCALLPAPSPWLLTALVAALVAVPAAPFVGPALLGRLRARGRAARLTAVRAQAQVRPLIGAAAHATISVLAEIVVFGILLRATGGAPDPIRLAVLLPLCIVASKLPFTPMGLGTREAAVLALLGGMGSPPTLLAASLLFGVVEQILPGALGAPLIAPFLARLARADRLQS